MLMGGNTRVVIRIAEIYIIFRTYKICHTDF